MFGKFIHCLKCVTGVALKTIDLAEDSPWWSLVPRWADELGSLDLHYMLVISTCGVFLVSVLSPFGTICIGRMGVSTPSWMIVCLGVYLINKFRAIELQHSCF